MKFFPNCSTAISASRSDAGFPIAFFIQPKQKIGKKPVDVMPDGSECRKGRIRKENDDGHKEEYTASAFRDSRSFYLTDKIVAQLIQVFLREYVFLPFKPYFHGKFRQIL